LGCFEPEAVSPLRVLLNNLFNLRLPHRGR
jgi:hypothetical protein